MALGSAAARNLTIQFWGPPGIAGTAAHSLGLLCFGACLGCTGFSILFNIHGPGMLLCTLGGIAAYVFLKALSQTGMLAKFQESLGAKVYDKNHRNRAEDADTETGYTRNSRVY